MRLISSSMGTRKIGKRKVPLACRRLGHQWDCKDPRACKGDHVCLRCMKPNGE